MLVANSVSAFEISQRGMADRPIFKWCTYKEAITFKFTSNFRLGDGFELAIVVDILLSVLCSKDRNVKRGGDSQTPKVLKLNVVI